MSYGDLSDLEKLKDRILAFFQDNPQLEEGARQMWCGDVKEMYYTAVLSDEALSPGAGGNIARAQGILDAAASRCDQVCSELHALGSSGLELEKELRAAFAAYQSGLKGRMPPSPSSQAGIPPARVVKKSDAEYELPCTVCGKTAIGIHPSGAREELLEGIVLAGITRSVGLDLKDKSKIIGWLARGDLASLHKYAAVEADIEGGLDAYCPECDRIYCRVHYNVREEWDQGFYDCSRGVCPQGHARLVDD